MSSEPTHPGTDDGSGPPAARAEGAPTDAPPTGAAPSLQPVAALRAAGRVLLRVPRVLAWGPPLLWALGIHQLSASAQPLGIEGFDGMAFVVNLAHAFEFGVLALLCLPLLPRRPLGAPGRPWVRAEPAHLWAIALACGLYALVDEAHQHAVPGRDASLFDVLTDWVGIGATLVVARRVGREPADAAGTRRALGRGFLACLAAAGLSTLWGYAAGHGLWFGR